MIILTITNDFQEKSPATPGGCLEADLEEINHLIANDLSQANRSYKDLENLLRLILGNLLYRSKSQSQLPQHQRSTSMQEKVQNLVLQGGGTMQSSALGKLD